MTLAGNVSGSLQNTISDDDDSVTNGPGTNISEEEQYLKDTLASYRRTVDAATCIQAAFGEQSFKLKSSNGKASEVFELLQVKMVRKMKNRKTLVMRASSKPVESKAEERVERSVVRVQAMFRPKRAQEEYRKIKKQKLKEAKRLKRGKRIGSRGKDQECKGVLFYSISVKLDYYLCVSHSK
nr:hypothetical protein [Tanacetum cinerariifolium]